MRFARIILTALLLVASAGSVPAFAQEHATPGQPAAQSPAGAQPAHSPESAAPDAEAGHSESGGLLQMGARLLNFSVLVGALVYFLRSPFAAYLASRSLQIRQDLVTAADLRAAATSQLAQIDRNMQLLPAELDSLRRQGVEDVNAEQGRIASTAAAERSRLLEQTRREIDVRLRVARRELTVHAAHLAVGVAEQRIRHTITPDDQMRLVDRYASQLREAR